MVKNINCVSKSVCLPHIYSEPYGTFYDNYIYFLVPKKPILYMRLPSKYPIYRHIGDSGESSISPFGRLYRPSSQYP